jgi:hypothetical protein
MKRTGFLGLLAGLFAIPVAAKAANRRRIAEPLTNNPRWRPYDIPTSAPVPMSGPMQSTHLDHKVYWPDGTVSDCNGEYCSDPFQFGIIEPTNSIQYYYPGKEASRVFGGP